jgi:hypothetical protein
MSEPAVPTPAPSPTLPVATSGPPTQISQPMLESHIRGSSYQQEPAVEYVFHAGSKRPSVEHDDESHKCKRVSLVLPTSTPYPDEAKEQHLTADEDVADAHERYSQIHVLLASRHISEPRSYKAAMQSPERSFWKTAADSEYHSLIENGTWTLVPPPVGRKILSCRWVWAIKYKGTGEIERYKARLVIRGYMQEYGIDYNEIFSPVIRVEVLRLLLTIGALKDLEIHQMDVKMAFLNGSLEEDIYMTQPKGYVVPGTEGQVCKLNKSLYGLKQAPRVLYETLCEFLTGLGFKRLIKDRCVFVGL